MTQYISGTNHNDFLQGTHGNDIFQGSLGNDTIIGNGGHDVVDYSNLHQPITLATRGTVFKGNGEQDKLSDIKTIIGAAGQANAIDASHADYPVSVDVDLSDHRLTVRNIPHVGNLNFRVQNFVNVIGTNQADSIIGNAQDNNLKGGAGNDTLDGNAGNDTLDGGQGKDTIVGGAGNDIIKGGAGHDLIYGDNYVAEASLVGSNLVHNGSFEHNSVHPGNSGVFNSIAGWHTTFGSGIEVIEQEKHFGAAADGHAWVELDSYSNSGMAQHIDTDAGVTYQLSVDYTPRQYISPSKIEVWWNGDRVTTLSGHGGHENNWNTYTFEVEGGHGDTTQLEFRAAGHSNGVGGFIDNIKVFEVGNDPLAHKLGTDKVIGHDKLRGGNGNDILRGGAGSDSLYGGAGNDVIEGTDSHTAGLDEKDRLNGGAGHDTFVLGNSETGFYNNQYWHDSVIVEDLNIHQDTVQLNDDGHYWLGSWNVNSYLYEYTDGHWDGVAVFENVHLNNHDLHNNQVFEYV